MLDPISSQTRWLALFDEYFTIAGSRYSSPPVTHSQLSLETGPCLRSFGSGMPEPPVWPILAAGACVAALRKWRRALPCLPVAAMLCLTPAFSQTAPPPTQLAAPANPVVPPAPRINPARCTDNMVSPDQALPAPVLPAAPGLAGAALMRYTLRQVRRGQVITEFQFDARTGALQMDGTPIPQDRCWAPYFVTTHQVVTVKTLAKFHMTATATITPATISEDGIDIKLTPPATTPTGNQALGGALSTMLSNQALLEGPPPTPPAPPPVDWEQVKLHLKALEDLLKPVNCALDPSCQVTAIADAVAKWNSLRTDVEAASNSVAPGDFYRDAPQFELFFARAQDIVNLLNNFDAAVTQAYPLPNPPPSTYPRPTPGDILAAQLTAQLTSHRQEFAGALARIAEAPPADRARLAIRLNTALNIGQDLPALKSTAGAVFKDMNDLRDMSEQAIVTVLNQPTTNQVVAISFALVDNWTPFALTPATANQVSTQSGGMGVISAAGSPVASSPAVKTTAAPTNPQPPVRAILLAVHRLIRFNAVGGFYWSTLRTHNYSVMPGPATTATAGGVTTVTPATSGTPYLSQNSRQIGAFAGLEIYIDRRDLFPGYLSNSMRWTPGFLVGTSATAPTNFMVGLNFEPVTGIDFYGGMLYGQETRLANGISSGPAGTQLSTSGTVPTTQSYVCCKVFIGVGLDAHFVTSIFTGLFGGGGAGQTSTSSASTTGGAGGGKGH